MNTHARQIESLVAPGVAEALGVDLVRPRPGTPAPANTTAEAIARVVRDLSLSGQRRVLAAAEAVADAEHHGQAVLRVHVVVATATNEARA